MPSGSNFTVDETRASFGASSPVGRRRHVALHWSTFVAAALGGFFLVASAWHASGFPDLISLCLVFVLGALVGYAAAVGMREVLVAQGGESAKVRLPAVEVPRDVARAAPGDATVDELVLWSVLTRRFRAAAIALERAPFDEEPPDTGSRSTGTITPAATSALAELTYVTARHDYEPVAELLGLPLPASRPAE